MQLYIINYPFILSPFLPPSLPSFIFTYHNVSKVHPCCRIYQYCILFIWQHNRYIPYFIFLSVDEHLGCFHFLAIINNTVMDIHVQAFVWTYIFT